MRPATFVLMFLFTASCYSQDAAIDLNQLLKTPTFTAPDSAKLAELKIPFRQDGLYGICNYDFEVVVQPQFDDIEAPDPLFNWFKAKKNGRWSIYNFTGEKIISIEALEKYKIEHKMVLSETMFPKDLT